MTEVSKPETPVKIDSTPTRKIRQGPLTILEWSSRAALEKWLEESKIPFWQIKLDNRFGDPPTVMVSWEYV